MIHKFKQSDPNKWKYGFAIFPKKLGNHWIWLEKYAYHCSNYKCVNEVIPIFERTLQRSHPTLGTFERDEFIMRGMMFIDRSDWKPVFESVEMEMGK